MHKSAVRRILLALVILFALGVGYIVWDTYMFVGAGLALERDVHSRFDRLSEAAAALGAAQQAYVAPGQQRGEALTQASVRIQELYDEIATVRRLTRSSDAASSLLAVGESIDALVKVDDRVREHLRADQELMAADLVYTEARQMLDAITRRLAALQEAEDAAGAGERRQALARGGAILATVALVWLAIMLLLARVPAQVAAWPSTPLSEPASATNSPADELRLRASVDAAAPADAVPANAVPANTVPANAVPPGHGRPPTADRPVDLGDAAAVCVELAQVTNGAALTRALAQAARVLNASGMIVWLGAGEELFAATAHGYGTQAIARLGAIPRHADNVTAAVWRSGKSDIVRSDDMKSGAIVAPLVGGSGCFGVLSVEVKDGLETNAAVRAVTTMIAAQLSTVVAPGPAASEDQAATA